MALPLTLLSLSTIYTCFPIQHYLDGLTGSNWSEEDAMVQCFILAIVYMERSSSQDQILLQRILSAYFYGTKSIEVSLSSAILKGHSKLFELIYNPLRAEKVLTMKWMQVLQLKRPCFLTIGVWFVLENFALVSKSFKDLGCLLLYIIL